FASSTLSQYSASSRSTSPLSRSHAAWISVPDHLHLPISSAMNCCGWSKINALGSAAISLPLAALRPSNRSRLHVAPSTIGRGDWLEVVPLPRRPLAELLSIDTCSSLGMPVPLNGHEHQLKVELALVLPFLDALLRDLHQICFNVLHVALRRRDAPAALRTNRRAAKDVSALLALHRLLFALALLEPSRILNAPPRRERPVVIILSHAETHHIPRMIENEAVILARCRPETAPKHLK